ncbi:MAG TPA: acyl-ACP--UDP-N-acetylglucosamine O-acyltransferase [Xanthobacteraceae bacterium]|jgi:UDP-N-acetylglucosamine acyltransferase
MAEVMAEIDPTARVETGAALGPDVEIGPYCVVGRKVTIGAGCRLMAHVHVAGHTSIGPGTVVYPFASLGTPPQSVKYRGGPTRLVIGAECQIREAVTMNTGTEDGGGITSVGDRGFFMVGSHVGHDCQIGKDVIFANNAVVGGHVVVGDNVMLGGQAAVHQYVRIGEGVMVGGMTGVGADVVPFALVFGAHGSLMGLNRVGLKRRGASQADLQRLRRAYSILFHGDGGFGERIEVVSREFEGDPMVGKIVSFIRNAGTRPIMRTRARETRGSPHMEFNGAG